MVASPVPPIDYSKVDYHYYYSEGINDICTCDMCGGLFKHMHIPYSTKLNNCKSLTKIDGMWICIHCRNLRL